jgi:phosphoribosylanthranilate isomerase
MQSNTIQEEMRRIAQATQAVHLQIYGAIQEEMRRIAQAIQVEYFQIYNVNQPLSNSISIGKKQTRKGIIIYYDRSSNFGLRLSIHPPTGKNKSWHAHIKNGHGKLHVDINLSRALELVKSPLLLFTVFEHFKKQLSND